LYSAADAEAVLKGLIQPSSIQHFASVSVDDALAWLKCSWLFISVISDIK
jgi:hypothetical protein